LAALGKGALTPEQLEALSRSLAKGKGDEAEALARLHKAGLLDPGALERAQRAAEPDAAALASLLKEKGGSRALTQMLAKGEKSAGGRGGAGADRAWKKAPPDEAGRFKPEALPPAELGALKKMALGAAPGGRAAPEVKKGEPPGSGALAGAAPGGGSSGAG